MCIHQSCRIDRSSINSHFTHTNFLKRTRLYPSLNYTNFLTALHRTEFYKSFTSTGLYTLLIYYRTVKCSANSKHTVYIYLLHISKKILHQNFLTSDTKLQSEGREKIFALRLITVSLLRYSLFYDGDVSN